MKKITTIFILLFSLLSHSQSISIQVLSAVEKDKKIDNAEVLIQRNGETTAKSYTNSQGKVTLNNSFQDDQTTILIIKKEGYSTLVVKCPCNGLTYALSPIMENLDGMRIVLNWGQSPEDLDSHLVFPNNHIFFSSKTGDQSNLDVDDTDSYGPETITIDQKKFGETYYYFVHDYSNKDNANTKSLSNSDAKVFVYVGQTLTKTYYIPKNKIGNIWNIFKINANGEIEDVNAIISKTENQVGLNDRNANDFSDSAVGAATAVSDNEEDDAISYNEKGDLAYKNKDVNSALNFYKTATEINPNFAQAYGSLGLMYIKKGMKAEAIWANRKAISTAAGSTKNTVKAGSYFNIAKIFEADRKYQDALNYYKLAKQNKQNPVYDNAIIRVKAKI